MSQKQVTLPITGMRCANCANTVEHTLKRLPGVQSATVNFANEKATVVFDPDMVKEPDLVESVKAAGYGVATARVELPITGMTCANCAATIERALKRTDGVLAASVNFASERATVEYVPGALTRADLVRIIRHIGYDVVEAQEEEPEDAERAAREAEIARQKRLLALGLLLSAPLFVLSMARDFGFLPAAWHGWLNWLFLALATPVQFYVGWDYFDNGTLGWCIGVRYHSLTFQATFA